MFEPRESAVVLLSGGLDSATAAAIAREDGCEILALSLDYGQRHRAELLAARALARALGARRHHVVAIDLSALGGSALTDPARDVPRDRSDREIGRGIPSTYVPARNTLLLSIAVAAAEAEGAQAVYLGVNAIDFSGYPDCRPAFLEAFERAAALGTRAGVEGHPIQVRAPLLHLTKADIIRRAVALEVPLGLTLSCYDPVPRGETFLHCGRCDACQLRRRGFSEANLPDPAPWEDRGAQ